MRRAPVDNVEFSSQTRGTLLKLKAESTTDTTASEIIPGCHIKSSSTEALETPWNLLYSPPIKFKGLSSKGTLGATCFGFLSAVLKSATAVHFYGTAPHPFAFFRVCVLIHVRGLSSKA